MNKVHIKSVLWNVLEGKTVHSDGVVCEVGVDTDLQVLQPDCEALDSLHAVLHVPHQQVECPVGEEALMGQVVLLLGESDGNMCLPFTTA